MNNRAIAPLDLILGTRWK